MAIKDLRTFMALLEAKGQLQRISAEVDPDLEIGEITDRVSKRYGPGLLFERPVRREDGHAYEMPVAINLFGTYERMAWALGVDADTGTWRDLDAVGRRLMELLPLDAPASVWDKLGIAKNAREEKLQARKKEHDPKHHAEMERLYRQHVLKDPTASQPILQIQGLKKKPKEEQPVG